MKKTYQISSTLLIILFIFFSFYSLIPRDNITSKTNFESFSTDNVINDLKQIAKTQHYYGSRGHKEVREYLVKRLEFLGIEIQIQESDFYDEEYNCFIKPKNIIGRIKGTNSEKALLITAHYDSAPIASFGASDAGSGLATILESLRVFLSQNNSPKNDIIVLFTDAEELGMLGAKVFMKKHPWAKDVGFAINFEARGSSGPSHMVIETNNGNSKILKSFIDSGIDYPVTSSLLYSIYKILPNNTDSTVYREYGDVEGIFFAFIDDYMNYHTENDNLDNISRSSIYHQGTYLIPMLRHFSNIDLSNLTANEELVYVNFPFLKIIHFPFTVVLPLAILAILLFFILIYHGLKKNELKIKLILKGFIPFLISIFTSTVIGFFGWELLLKIYPQYSDLQHNFTYNGYYYITFFVLLSVLITSLVYKTYYIKNDIKNSSIAPLFTWIIINVLISLFFKGAGFFIIPLFFGLLSTLILIRYSERSILIITFLSAPLLFIFPPLIEFIPVTLGLNSIMISCLLVVLVFGLLLPVYGYIQFKKVFISLVLFASIAFFTLAHFKSNYSILRKNPKSLVYFEDKDVSTAFFATYDDKIDNWLEENLGVNPKKSSNSNQDIYFKNQNFSYYNEVQFMNTNNSSFELIKHHIIDDKSYLNFKIKPNRNLSNIILYLDREIIIKNLTVNGLLVNDDEFFTERQTDQLIKYYVDNNIPLEVSFTTSKINLPLKLIVEEKSFDLFEHNLLKRILKPRPLDVMISPYYESDAIITKQTFYIN